MTVIPYALTGFSVARLENVPPDGQMPVTDGLDFIPALPGRAIHYDLMEAGMLENPYGSHDSAVNAGWVPQTDWVYRAEFDLPAVMASCDRYFLELDCVDTFADVFVNGKRVGTCKNMFVRYKFELFDVKEKNNSLVIHIKGHGRTVSHKGALAEEKLGGPGRSAVYLRERAQVRRYQRSYADDFAYVGQAFWGIGLVRPVNLIGLPKAFLKDTAFSVRSLDRSLSNRDTAALEATCPGSPELHEWEQSLRVGTLYG